jgi:hypothetical protein
VLSLESMLSKARDLDVTTKTMHSAREEDNFYRTAVSPAESGKRRLDKSRSRLKRKFRFPSLCGNKFCIFARVALKYFSLKY